MKRFLILLLAAAGLSLAQTADDVRRDLELTDQVIERVRPLVQQSNNERAQALLSEAEMIQASAWTAHRNRMYRRARGLTLTARSKAKDAALLVELPPEQVQAEIKRTSDLMNEAGPWLNRSPDSRVQEFWRLVQTEQATARREFDAGRMRSAVRWTFAARGHLKAAVDIIRRNLTPERVQAQLERTDLLIERAAGVVGSSGNERAVQLLQKGRDLQEQARAAFNASRLVQALRLTLTARDMAFRAWEMVGGSGRAMVEQALAETDALLGDWRAEIAAAASADATVLLEQAEALQQTAHQGFADNQFRAAFGATTRARRLLQRAIDIVQAGEPSTEE